MEAEARLRGLIFRAFQKNDVPRLYKTPRRRCMRIRSLSWGAADLSWSVVIEELLRAAEELGHEVNFTSTNGTANMQYWNDAKVAASLARERNLLHSGDCYDLDLTFTVPPNYVQRFLKNSKVKLAITDYESTPVPPQWLQWMNIPHRILAGSNWVKEAFVASRFPEDKVAVVPHGVDTRIFNPGATPYPIQTNKSFKFLCVAEPHYRKQLDVLLDLYCETFTAADDVCLVLKTKLFKNNEQRKPFEQDLRPILASLVRKFGPKIPEIKLITARLPSLASLYAACNAFVLMTVGEGFGIPFLEAMACGLPTIAPRFGGQLDFMNDENSILCSAPERLARPVEQYWGQTPGS